MKKFITFLAFVVSLVGAEITVYGENELSLTPDNMVINLQITSNGENLSDAKAQNDVISAEFDKLLDENNIQKDSVRLVSLNFYSTDNYDQSGNAVGKNYTATKYLSLNLKDLNKSDIVLDNLMRMGISYADISYKNSEFYNEEEKSLEVSINSAIKKAQNLANSINKDLGEIVYIEEVGNDLVYATQMTDSNPVVLIKTKVKMKFALKDKGE